MFNINVNKEKRIEQELNAGISFCGRWNIEIINPERGTSVFPLGSELKNNILTQSFYDTFINCLSSNSLPRFNTLIASSIAVVGSGTAETSISDYKLSNQIYESSYTAVDAGLCGYIDDFKKGSRTIYRAWDFTPNLSADSIITEAGIKNPWVVGTGITGTQQKLFSRFVFPRSILVPKMSIIRLRYELTCTIPALIKPIEVSCSAGDFVGDGFFKPVGLWHYFFGGISSAGVADSYGFDYLPIAPTFYPDSLSIGSGGAVQVKFFKNFPSIDYPIDNIQYTTLSTAEQFIGNGICYGSSMGTVSMLPYNAADNGRIAKYSFGTLNPLISNSNWGGFFFKRYVAVQNYYPLRASYLTVQYQTGAGLVWNPSDNPNTWAAQFTNSLWFWKFNSPQTRYTDQSVDVEIKQSAIIENYSLSDGEGIRIDDKDSPIIVV